MCTLPVLLVEWKRTSPSLSTAPAFLACKRKIENKDHEYRDIREKFRGETL